MIDPEFDAHIKMVESTSEIAEIERSFEVVREYFNASHIAYIWRNKRKKLQAIHSLGGEFDQSLFSDPAFLVKLCVKISGNGGKRFKNSGFHEDIKRWSPNSQTSEKTVVSIYSHTIFVFNLEGNASAFTFSKLCSEVEWVEVLKRNKMLLTLYARAVADKIYKASFLNSHHATYRLSSRETDVISSLARGLSRSEAAHALQISEHTVRVHVENAKRKLGAQNTVHAVASAVASGAVLSPD